MLHLGDAALAGASASFPIALVIGVVYVFGMVAPLALIAVLWDRRDWGASNLFRNRQLTLRLGRLRRMVPLTVVISSALMVFMGVLTAALALSGRGMATSNWQVEMAASLQHFASVILDALSWLPGWAGTTIVLGALALLVRAELRQGRSESSSTTLVPPSTEETDQRPRQETP